MGAKDRSHGSPTFNHISPIKQPPLEFDPSVNDPGLEDQPDTREVPVGLQATATCSWLKPSHFELWDQQMLGLGQAAETQTTLLLLELLLFPERLQL